MLVHVARGPCGGSLSAWSVNSAEPTAAACDARLSSLGKVCAERHEEDWMRVVLFVRCKVEFCGVPCVLKRCFTGKVNP